MSLRCGPSSENVPLPQINYELAGFFFTFLILLKSFHVSAPIYWLRPCFNMELKTKEAAFLFFCGKQLGHDLN